MTPRPQWIPACELPEENILECIVIGGRETITEGFFIRPITEECTLQPGFYRTGTGQLQPCPWVQFYIARPSFV